MRKNLKLSILLVLLICITFTGIAYASDSFNIQVLFNCMNIMIKGEKVDIDNFVYNNTTYVPLRKTAELFDKVIIWDNKTNTINITDKKNKIDGFFTECDNMRTALITNVNDNILELEFQMKNITHEDITITLHYPFFDFIIYDENEFEIYKHSEEYGISIALIKDEKINSGKKFAVNNNLDLTDKKLIPGETYKVVFFTSFEMKSEKKRYKLCEEAYFRIPTIPQTE